MWQRGFDIGHDTPRPEGSAWIEALKAALDKYDNNQRDALARGFWSGIDEGEDERAYFAHCDRMDRLRELPDDLLFL